MRNPTITFAAVLLVGGCAAAGQDGAMGHQGSPAAMIASAASAAPESIADEATIVDLEMNVLRKGSNGYTCLPDTPNDYGPNPMCLDANWLSLAQAWKNKTEPSYDGIGVAYMLGGDSAVSNTDPYATEFTSEDDWVDGLGAHLMIVAPGDDPWEGHSTDPFNGGPWIMWPDTPYEHLMVPIDSYGR